MSERRKRLLTSYLSKTTIMKKLYLSKANHYRKINNVTEMLIIGSGTLATTTLIMSFSIVASPLLITSVTFSGIATLGTALKRASNIDNKYERHKSTYLAYSELEREIKHRISQNGFTNEQYDSFITDINNRLNLIEDNAIPISVTGGSGRNLTMSPVI